MIQPTMTWLDLLYVRMYLHMESPEVGLKHFTSISTIAAGNIYLPFRYVKSSFRVWQGYQSIQMVGERDGNISIDP